MHTVENPGGGGVPKFLPKSLGEGQGFQEKIAGGALFRGLLHFLTSFSKVGMGAVSSPLPLCVSMKGINKTC